MLHNTRLLISFFSATKFNEKSHFYCMSSENTYTLFASYCDLFFAERLPGGAVGALKVDKRKKKVRNFVRKSKKKH